MRSAADEIGQLVELRPDLAPRNLARALARIHVEEQARADLGSRAGEARERHRAMAVLERQLDRHAERIAVLRAMAIATQPARPGLVEGGTEFARAGRSE